MSEHAPFRTAFAHGVAAQKYMNPHGEKHWSQTASRVTKHPLAALPVSGRAKAELYQEIYPLINDRHFIPGGRYLYGCGNDFHQVQNCLLLRAEAWGVMTVWIGAGPRPVPGAADHVLWTDADPGAAAHDVGKSVVARGSER